MERRIQLRRVVQLCCSFGRNLTFYRVGQSIAGRYLLEERAPSSSFWRQANSNFLDLAVLEWCKLFGDHNGQYHWRRVASDPLEFKTGLQQHLGARAGELTASITAMRRYRDKFVAHLDEDAVMEIPMLDVPQQSVQFYHRHVVANEASIPGGRPGTGHRCRQPALAMLSGWRRVRPGGRPGRPARMGALLCLGSVHPPGTMIAGQRDRLRGRRRGLPRAGQRQGPRPSHRVSVTPAEARRPQQAGAAAGRKRRGETIRHPSHLLAFASGALTSVGTNVGNKRTCVENANQFNMLCYLDGGGDEIRTHDRALDPITV
jgi:hypothetical protein